MRRASRAAGPTTPPGIDALHACYGRRFSFAFYKHMVNSIPSAIGPGLWHGAAAGATRATPLPLALSPPAARTKARTRRRALTGVLLPLRSTGAGPHISDVRAVPRDAQAAERGEEVRQRRRLSVGWPPPGRRGSAARAAGTRSLQRVPGTRPRPSLIPSAPVPAPCAPSPRPSPACSKGTGSLPPLPRACSRRTTATQSPATAGRPSTGPTARCV
jgi:hypothetical protein